VRNLKINISDYINECIRTFRAILSENTFKKGSLIIVLSATLLLILIFYFFESLKTIFYLKNRVTLTEELISEEFCLIDKRRFVLNVPITTKLY